MPAPARAWCHSIPFIARDCRAPWRDVASARPGCACTALHPAQPVLTTACLGTAHGAGWGLDFLLPFVLGYPNASIAVIDSVCMVHPLAEPAPAKGIAAGPAPAPRKRMYDLDLPKSP